MAVRYCGRAVVRVYYSALDSYRGTITVPKDGRRQGSTHRFADLHPPARGYGARIAYDSPEAYDRTVCAALSFALAEGSDCTDEFRSDLEGLVEFKGNGFALRRMRHGPVQ